jgi:hypothetical protein
MKKLIIILPFVLAGCMAPRTLVEYSQTDQAGRTHTMKVSSQKEITADDFEVNFDVQKGNASLKARHLESRSAAIIDANVQMVHAEGTAAGNTVKCLGGAVGEAGACIIGTEGAVSAVNGIGTLIGTKMQIDAQKEAAASEAFKINPSK